MASGSKSSSTPPSGLQLIVGVRGGGWGFEEAREDADDARSAAREGFGFDVDVHAEAIDAGRGGAEVALLLTLSVTGIIALATISPKEATKNLTEWAREVGRLRLAERLRTTMIALGSAGYRVRALSLDAAAWLALDMVKEQTGQTPELIWWDDMPLDPRDWMGPPEYLTSTAERLYFFIIDTDDERSFVVMKSDGEIVGTYRQWLPRDWMELNMWRRHGEGNVGG